MTQSKLTIGVIGLAIFILAPTQVLSSQIMSEFMETDIKTRTNEDLKQIKLPSLDVQKELITQAEDDEKVIQKDRVYIGKFTITHYCSCKICNGKWAGYPAANGERLQDGYTIAVDTDVIPLNTMVYIDGYGTRKAQDTGNKIKGNKIDVYMSNHDECLKMGIIKDVKVYVYKGE